MSHGRVDCEGLMHQATPTTTGAAARRPLGLRAQMALVAMLAVLASLVGQGIPGATATPATSDAVTRVVVEARAGLGAVAGAIAEHGGQVVDVLAPFRMVVADVPAGAVDAVEAEAATGAVSEDVPLQVQSAEGTPDAEAVLAAPDASPDPSTGDGVGVVVVDTGIAQHRDLKDRVVARYDYDDRQPGRASDRHGHGTFMAGLVAADGPHPGVAPGAHLVSVRVADADGQTSLSSVLQGLVVADMARERHDAPVVLLALSGPRGDVPDPLMVVLEMLWSRGSTVVVAAGNHDDGELASPGWDPFLLTVGALGADDTVPDWSGRGDIDLDDGLAWSKPDVVAPGVSVVGLRAPGSTIDREHRDARVDGQYFLGTGTSMAAAHVAGAAAAVLAENGSLAPDAVKGLLMATARGIEGEAAGRGAVDLAAALAQADAFEGSDAYEPIGPLPVPDTDGELQPDGWSWDGWSWDGWSWDGWSWDGWSWDGWSWDGWSWDGWSWDGWSWDGWSWDGWSWDGWSWDGWSWDSRAWG